MEKALEKVLLMEPTREAFQKMKDASDKKQSSCADEESYDEHKMDERWERCMKSKALGALRGYFLRKLEDSAKAAIARKFSYIRRLKAVLRLLRENIQYKKSRRQRYYESELHYKYSVLTRFFAVFKEEDALSKAREAKLLNLLDRKQTIEMRSIFSGLIAYRDQRQEKRMKSGMASLLRNRSLALSAFNRFR